MGYCTTNDVQRILPEKVQIGDQNIGTPSPGRPGSGSNRSNMSPEECERYILYAQQYIDARLKPIYVCPLRRIKGYETEVTSNITAGTNVDVTVNDSGAFIRGDIVRIQDKDGIETVTVDSTPTMTTIRFVRVYHDYLSSNDLKVSILEYPDPIPVIAARLTASFILDRLFVAEQSPDVSTYGKTQRNLATLAIDDILKGVVLLTGQDHTGYRFIRLSLKDTFASPAEVTKGEEKDV